MLSVSFPAKAKSPQPESTSVEIIAAPLPWWAAAIALTVAVVFTFAFTQISLRATPTSGEWNRLVGQRLDDHGNALGQIYSGRAHQADVVILGTSAAREALPADAEIAAKLLANHPTLRGVANLATSSQSLIDSLYLADASAPRPGQLFVLFVSFSSLRQKNPFDPMERGYFLHAPQVMIAKYPNSGIFPAHWHDPFNRLMFQLRSVRQHFGRYLEYRLNHWILEHVYGRSIAGYQPHRHGAKKMRAPANDVELFDEFRRELSLNCSANFKYVTPTLEALLGLLKRNRAMVAIGAPPEFNREIRDAFPDEFGQFEESIRSLQTRFEFETLNLNDRIEWTKSDFVDLVHLSPSGREKWIKAMAAWLHNKDQRAVYVRAPATR